jgi:ketosteroid isomerase-like protein
VFVEAGPTVVLERIQEAINAHDLEALVDCFTHDVHSEQPTRPGRGFRGRDELRGYWELVLGSGGDFKADLLRSAGTEDTAWAEWCWHGKRRDGSTFARAGVTIYGLRDGRIAWIRLYMEPIQGDPETIAGWVMRDLTQLGGH